MKTPSNLPPGLTDYEIEYQAGAFRPMCTGCNKHPEEIQEYVDAAANEPDEYADASDYVQQEEGTYNSRNGHFLCTDCYVKAGMPSSPKGWTAP